MSYCRKCGNELEKDAKFCTKCGTKVNIKAEERKIVYDGEIHKCPNCGESLKAFTTNCPTCGFELRNSKASSAISEFADKVNNLSSTDECAKLIRNFPIPNNKEDILEFMLLAASNLVGQSNRIVFEAWLAKFEQSYQKAKVSFENEEIFYKIDKIYQETEKKINKEKNIHNVSDLKKWLDRVMINPIFGIAVIGVLIYALIRLLSGKFAGIDIIFDAIILTIVYKLTNKNNKNGGV